MEQTVRWLRLECIDLHDVIEFVALIYVKLHDWLLFFPGSPTPTGGRAVNKYYNLSTSLSFSQKQTSTHTSCPLSHVLLYLFNAHSLILMLWAL